ncbi:SRPBCC family protein [Methylobacterium oryzihabitans]|uniref:SRPBCC domain-containing protein n=1 Tax=Methylobacterium oryzihabitans TaxID=2499852 RepID=A0A3S2VPW7_9HYPH|nr:hypothetical protein [Methylobacterium oryzihabitans]RVU14171.1 hypothetical protein EOE48_24180 [Methylobacterium oryzihabitans]
MQNRAPILLPHDEDRYLDIDPVITFMIERRIRAWESDISRAWTDPEIFKRWITPPGHQLVDFSADPDGIITFVLKGEGDDDTCVEYTLNCATRFRNRQIEFKFSTSQVPGMGDLETVHLQINIGRNRQGVHRNTPSYELLLGFDNPSLWHCTSHVGLHNFWLEATQRMAQFVEDNSDLLRQKKLTHDCEAD